MVFVEEGQVLAEAEHLRQREGGAGTVVGDLSGGREGRREGGGREGGREGGGREREREAGE